MRPTCECSDSGCPEHKEQHFCPLGATRVLYRVGMDDMSGVMFCPECASDAMYSGLFTDDPELAGDEEAKS